MVDEQRTTQLITEADIDVGTNLRITQGITEVDIDIGTNPMFTQLIIEIDILPPTAKPRTFVMVVG